MELLNSGKVILVFVDKKSKKPCFTPEKVMNKLKEKFS